MENYRSRDMQRHNFAFPAFGLLPPSQGVLSSSVALCTRSDSCDK